MSGMSQKEMAEQIARDIKDKQKKRVELGVIEQAKDDLHKERLINESIMREAIAEQGYIISIPDTEVILYEDEGYQLLYCNNIDHPGKVSFLMALKSAARKITGRTPITQQGYVAVPMSRDQFNLILASHTRHAKQVAMLKEQIDVLEKDIAPLRYIDHLIKKHSIDTKE